jgi:hypothetical protein
LDIAQKKIKDDRDDATIPLMGVVVGERTIIIHQGGVTADGPTLEILQDEALPKKSGLEKPLQMQNCPERTSPACL